MLLINDLKEIKQRTDYLLLLATKLTRQDQGAYSDYDKHLYSTRSKELYRFIKNKMEQSIEREKKEEDLNQAVKKRIEFINNLEKSRNEAMLPYRDQISLKG